jgi:uncharacterized protein YjbI with pentapeptide repeats
MRRVARLKSVSQGLPWQVVARVHLADSTFKATAAEISIEESVFERVSFEGLSVENLHVHGSRFVDCSFGGLLVSDSLVFGDGLTRSHFVRCGFDDADLKRLGYVGQSRFELCTFRDSHLTELEGGYSDWIGCTFTGRLFRVLFRGPKFEGISGRPQGAFNEFVANDFTRADLVDCTFSDGIDIDAQRMPAGPGYIRLDDFPRRLRAVSQIVSTMADSPERRYFERLLDVYDAYSTQPVLFTRRPERSPIPDAIEDRFFEMLASA